VINLCNECEEIELFGKSESTMQLDNGITVSVGDIEISVHSNELTFNELEERLLGLIDKIDERFENKSKNYLNYTS
jgi:hypothetical protein